MLLIELLPLGKAGIEPRNPPNNASRRNPDALPIELLTSKREVGLEPTTTAPYSNAGYWDLTKTVNTALFHLSYSRKFLKYFLLNPLKFS